MSSLDDTLRVVIDAGSYSTKAGFGYESSPRSVMYTTVGRFRRAGLHDGIRSVCCGNEAVMRQGIMNLVWPVQEGFIRNWEEMEKLWHHVFYKELKIPPEESRLMHTVHALIPRKDKEKMAEIMFETFTVQGLYMVRTPVAALYASGRTTGIVWENGSASSYVTPIFEGYHLKHAAMCSPVTGDFLTNFLERMVKENGYAFKTPKCRAMLEDIKAKVCYVAEDYPAELEASAASGGIVETYYLPDGQQVVLGDERFKCPESIFQPTLEASNCPGLVELICSSVLKCDVDCRPLMYSNLVPAGGSTMFRGIVKRLTRDLKMRLPGVDVQVDDLGNREHAQWMGASAFASLDHLKGFWMSSKEYFDLGADAVNYKFF